MVAVVMFLLIGSANATGTLTPIGADMAAMQIRAHHVNVVINNGFAMTEVHQTFFNPNDRALEARYSFPIPRNASLSEMTIYAGEKEIHGEVIEKKRASEIYTQERGSGNNTGMAEKRDIQAFDFAVSPVPARQETRIRFVYYQPLEVDTGIGRYVYPLEDGGTDDVTPRFWTSNKQVDGPFSVHLELKSSAPVASVRVPGFDDAAITERLDSGHYKVRLERQNVALDRDFVFYYKLDDNLPGRIELIPYRAGANGPGTFMLVVTPGLDLQPLRHGADYTFVLDVSGSMNGKIASLADGVTRAIGDLKPEDRVRVVVFSNTAQDISGGWTPATSENVDRLTREVRNLHPQGGTNVYAGLHLALSGLDDARATSIILVTDGVTNQGIVDPREFHKLTRQYDVRIFGFLMGNNANWPLMRTIAESSGGFYAAVSNSDDIVGQVLLAKSKITFEALHDARLEVSGVGVSGVSGESLGKVYRGQQLVLFGRYSKAGPAKVSLTGRMTGEDKVYSTTFDFPAIDTENPEIERLWALARIEDMEVQRNIGQFDGGEFETAVRDLGLAYQLVTDYTSMLVLRDEDFARHGIERANQARVAREREAQAIRAASPARDRRADHGNPAFTSPAPSVGGGAIDPFSAMILLSLAGSAAAVARSGRGRLS
jgi:Ca-activated chloride channel family protein